MSRLCLIGVASWTNQPNMRESIEKLNIFLESYDVLDSRVEGQARTIVSSADLTILGGSLVPIQNRFFEKIGLRQIVANFDGVLLGASAGSMNCADTVYSPPELDDEAIDPTCRRFLRGLNLTKTMLVPHYDQMINITLDELDNLRNILIPDGVGRRFYGIVDGSFLYIHEGKEELFDESNLIENKSVRQLTVHRDRLKLE